MRFAKRAFLPPPLEVFDSIEIILVLFIYGGSLCFTYLQTVHFMYSPVSPFCESNVHIFLATETTSSDLTRPNLNLMFHFFTLGCSRTARIRF